MAQVPDHPKIYHIVHVDRLPSILNEGGLTCDADVLTRSLPGTTIGMNKIKQRRLSELKLSRHPDLYVGSCVPFYFCPRSVMLFVIHRANHADLQYKGGQEPIIHLEADVNETVSWAESSGRRWAFTLSNAGSRYFEDRADLAQLDEIDWHAVRATDWRNRREEKQAEFLIESSFKWDLVTRIGVYSSRTAMRVHEALASYGHRPPVEVRVDWYY